MLVGSCFVGDHLVSRDFGPYEIIFVNVITFAMVMLRDFVPNGIILGVGVTYRTVGSSQENLKRKRTDRPRKCHLYLLDVTELRHSL